MIINKLYSLPETFDPVTFHRGVNLIIGERDETSEKTNGVGKSLCIEFINFCLLKDFARCRVSRLPDEAFSADTYICLDFEIGNSSITVKRNITRHAFPVLVIDGNETEFEVEDAMQLLTKLLYKGVDIGFKPSFRSLISLLMRDERSEFKSITKCHDTNLRIPDDYAPHLYFLGVDPSSYGTAKGLQKKVDDVAAARRKITSGVKDLTGKTIKDAKAELNELTSQVEKIKIEMDNLENAEGYDIVRDEIIDLESQLEHERTLSNAIKSELSKIKVFIGDNYIDEEEVGLLYDRFKSGLGELIKKDLKEVVSFKKKIDSFQETLIDSRKEALTRELAQVKSRIKSLDKRYQDKLSIIDQKGALKSLKTTVVSYQSKAEELGQLSSFINRFDDCNNEITHIKNTRRGEIAILQSQISEAKATKVSIENQILEMHEFIVGNRKSYFEVKVSEKKDIVEIEFRIYDDGSHSNERVKVFLYDLSLLFKASRHLGFLVHDNIFEVDEDTLIKSLNYLHNNLGDSKEKQYIFTINADRLRSIAQGKLLFGIDLYQVAAFTKANRFLKRHYQEIKKKK